MGKIKAIIFDLDNTLIDFMKMKEEAAMSAIRAMIKVGLKADESDAYKKFMITYKRLGIESQNAFQEFLKSEVGRIDEKMLAAAINAYLKTKDSFLKPYPNVKPMLRKLKNKGIKLAIVTDAPKVKAYQRLLAMNVEKYFDFVIGFEDTEKKKKTEIPLKVAIEKLKLKPGEIMAIGDSIKRDVIPARKLDMISVFAKYGSSEKVGKIKPDFEVNDFSEILKMVYFISQVMK
jgi:HAD superfamily hydrolase (TIGR02253 family)